ncbi:MAG: hypothetical protein QOE70_6238 [Chthoniobacter sp.]|jgi:hypothetical protein|nr:hypothetical protein [Chthoniobacter sp.]
MKSSRKSFLCPVCGEEVSPNAKVCPECGACDKSGWRQDSIYDGLDLPDEEFDYENFVAEEFGRGVKKAPVHWMWWAVAVILLLAFAALLFHW